MAEKHKGGDFMGCLAKNPAHICTLQLNYVTAVFTIVKYHNQINTKITITL